MDGETIFIEGPIDLELDGALVRAKVHTGERTLVFVATVHDFLASFALAAKVAQEWRGGLVEVRELRQH